MLLAIVFYLGHSANYGDQFDCDESLLDLGVLHIIHLHAEPLVYLIDDLNH